VGRGEEIEEMMEIWLEILRGYHGGVLLYSSSLAPDLSSSATIIRSVKSFAQSTAYQGNQD
jgi:hypothetical protein